MFSTVPVYYNDNNSFVCDVLSKEIEARRLYNGVVDRRSIREVSGYELRKYGQVHLFAGVGGIPYGLKRAGLPASTRILTGGFPCQPFSVAGKQRGTEDDRHLWPEMLRVITELKPAWVLGENVPGIIPIFIDQAIDDLEAQGYTCETFVLPAIAFDAAHRRDRVFLMGYSEQIGRHRKSWWRSREKLSVRYLEMAERPYFHSNKQGFQDTQQERKYEGPTPKYCGWLPEPGVGRVAHGVPNRVDRLRALGNAVVPQVIEHIGKIILEVERGNLR